MCWFFQASRKGGHPVVFPPFGNSQIINFGRLFKTKTKDKTGHFSSLLLATSAPSSPARRDGWIRKAIFTQSGLCDCWSVTSGWTISMTGDDAARCRREVGGRGGVGDRRLLAVLIKTFPALKPDDCAGSESVCERGLNAE